MTWCAKKQESPWRRRDDESFRALLFSRRRLIQPPIPRAEEANSEI